MHNGKGIYGDYYRYLKDIFSKVSNKELIRLAIYELNDYSRKKRALIEEELRGRESNNAKLVVINDTLFNFDCDTHHDINRCIWENSYRLLCERYKEYYEFFTEVSIRGRFAFLMMNLENILDLYGINNDRMDEYVLKLWEFCYANDLGKWSGHIWADCPIELEVENYLKSLETMNLDINKHYVISKLIKDIKDMGEANLYCGYSNRNTMEYLLRFIDNLNNHKLPRLEKEMFREFSVKEEHGWGKALDYRVLSNESGLSLSSKKL